LGTAVSTGDISKLTSLWSEDALLIDDRGDEVQGRAALQERFTGTLGQPGSSSVQLHPEKITFPATKIAAVVGSISRKFKNHSLPTARFSMLLEKNGNAWLVKQVTETPIVETSAFDHLKELEWLIGSWKIEDGNNKARLEIDWGSTRSFIIIKTIRNKDGVEEVDTQVIGWDPRKKEIVSWHFGNHGGFGYGKWSRLDESWEVQFVGVGHMGNATRATNIFTQKSPTEFKWQATEQSSDDVPIADGEAITVQKIK
jgi:ketosteroid isomerase-like protein